MDRKLRTLSTGPSFVVGALALAGCSTPAPPPARPIEATTSASAPSPLAPSASAPSASAIAPAPPLATTPFERALDALYAARRVGDTSLSLDGSRLAWAEASPEPAGGASVGLRVLDRADPAALPRVVTAGGSARREYAAAWSPDARSLAFLSDAGPDGKTQLYLATVGSAEPARRLTDLKGSLAVPRFSPDGKTIALLFTESAPPPVPTEVVTPEPGERDQARTAQRLVLIDAATGVMRPLTRAGLHVFEYDWSPSGDRLAATAAPAPGGAHWFVAQLHVIDAASGSDRSIFKPPLQICSPRWSPDGRSIAFIGGLMSDQGGNGGDVFVVPADGGAAPRNVTPGFHGSAISLWWPTTGGRILFHATVDGGSAIAAAAPAGGVEVLWSGSDETSYSFSVSRDGAVSALGRESFSHVGDVWAGELGKWRQITHVGEALPPSWGEVKSLRWKSSGVDVQGWLLPPRVVDPGKRAPLVVVVHGGPAWVSKPRFDDLDLLAAEGYFVFFPNPRGSFGQGEAFTEANIKDFGGGDLRDILAGIDEVIRVAPVDAHRLALYGWSYGGFMAMWAPTQTTRFRAAMAGAGIADWQSYWGQTEIVGWMPPYFGATVYDDPRPYLRSSPIEGVKRVKTPTLILVGENDVDCPAPQSREWWRALSAQGVETQLVVYPGEAHHFQKPAHRRDRMSRTLRWFDAHLK